MNSVVAAHDPGGMIGYITTPRQWSTSPEMQPPCMLPIIVISSSRTSKKATSRPAVNDSMRMPRKASMPLVGARSMALAAHSVVEVVELQGRRRHAARR